MRKIITISTQTISNAVFVCKKLPKTALMALFATLLSIGVSSNVSAQCSNMTLNNVTPPWNGFEFCDNGSGYNPAAINAPTINYVGSCTNTPSYTYVWEFRVNFNPTWTTVASGTGSAFVPGYDPPAQFNSTPGSPLNFYQWRITVTDNANGGQTAQSGNYTVSIGSQMTGSTSVTPITCVGANDASINLTVNGGLTNKTYSWSTGATTEDISGLAPGTYTVTVTDGGCAAYTTTATVTTNPSGTVHNINSGKNFCSIQAAINDANTNNGDTINVDAGTFAENIVVSKSVKILGPNKTVDPCSGSRVAEAIVVPATNSVRYGEIFHVAASNVTISGFTINGDNSTLASGATNISGADLNAAEGITVYETGINNLTATNNIIKNLSYFGITLYDYPAGVPSTGHVISNNKIQDLGTYNDTNSVDNINFWGGAVLLYNNQYAAVTNNCIDQVRIGVQTGNYSQANPGAAAYQVISGNTMTNVRRRGIFHNLAYSTASPYTLANNTISGVANANETNWSGILMSSMSVASTSTGNIINGITSTNPTSGIEVWNVKSSSPAAISGGSVSGVTNGVFVNNYDGYPTAGSDAPDGGNATLSGIAISGCTNGIYVKDNASSTHAGVNLAIGAGVTVNGGTTGLKIENSAASVGASISDLAFTGQSGNYITLVSNANNFSATSASFDGQTGATATLAQNYAIEDKISHKTDNGSLGFVRVKATNVFVTTNSGSIQRGVDAATAADVVNVNSGSFNEDVNINKQVTLMGAGCGSTTVSGPIGGQGATFLVGAAGIIIDGFSITRDGNNVTDWNNGGLNTAGIAIQGTTNSAEVRNNCINGMRTAIDINNSNGNNVHNNTIDNNRTGMIFRNQTDNTNVSENFITNNWTVGILFLDGSFGTNSPVQTAANCTFNNNNISGNWYGEVVDRQTGGSLLAPGTNMKNFDCNWYGATSQPVTTTANSTEPGYAALIPVIFGGTAVAPGGQPDIAGAASANIDYVSWLVDGTDNAGTNGFQPVSGSCSGTPITIASAVTTPTSCGVTGTIDMVFTGGTTPYTVAWSGAATGSQSAASSPSLISGLVNGTYTVTITDMNGTTASTVAVVDNLPVKNITANTFHATIQAGINAASANDVLEVCTGTYNENININKALTVKGPNAAISCINGTRAPEATIASLGASGTIAVTISSDNVQLLGFNISNANGSFGVYSKGNSNVLIENNIVSNIGNNTTGSSPSYGISIEAGSAAASANINIAHNCVSNIRGGANTSLSGAAGKANNGSGVGIGAGFSTAAFDINGLAIFENLITNITASTVAFSDGGKGAYGININVGANTSPAAAGKANASVVAANDISNLEGLWAHGIGLEGETPNAIVLNNAISNLIDHKGNTDAIGVLVEDNPGSATVIISENSFTNMAFGVKNTTTPTVNAECNWFGGMTNAIVSSKNTGNVDYTPWLVNGTDNNSLVLGFQPVSGSCTGTPVSLSETHTDVSCFGGTNGAIDMTISGGTTPYTIAWSNSASTEDINGLTAGTYTVLVTDANGSTATLSVIVTEPAVLAATGTQMNEPCNGNSLGEIDLSITGGTSPFSYVWSNSATTQDINGLSAGTYSVLVTDAHGCTTTANFTITEPDVLNTVATKDNDVICNGMNNGSATAHATGGTTPYSFLWDDANAQTDSNAVNLAPGTYNVLVTDAHGCTTVSSVTITEPNLLTTSISGSSDVSCNGGNDGSATASSNGGTLPYSYVWSNGQTNAMATGLLAGSYTYTVTDGHGCTATGSVTINQPTALVASSSLITAVQCHGGTATISVGAAGGSAPYSGTGTYTVTAGPHTYTVTDDHGCTSSTTITVTEPDELVASATQGSPILCNGGTTTVTVGATGGTATYTGIGTFTVGAGTHSYTVTDANGCTSTASITISEPDLLVASSSVTTPIHCNGGTGVVTVSAVGGTMPYTGATTYTVSAGSYNYTVTDANGCTSATSITVTEPAIITGASSEHACDTYSWNSNTYTTSGVYVGHFPAANGCDSVHTLTLTVGYSSASSSTVTQSLSYTWPVNGVTYTLSGTYTATSLNGTGCTETTTLNLTILGVTIVNARVFLDGAYDPNLELMTDSLRVNGLIPSTEPYTASPYNRTPINDPTGKNLAPGVLSVSGANAIVDWILLEVRSTTSPYPIIATRRCLVQRDGEIVDTNGVSPVIFASVPVGSYYISVKHRNHLGVMLANPQTLTLAGGPVDFTQQALWTKPSIPAIVNTPAKSYGLTQVLWAGDALYNKNVKYNGASNDKDVVLVAVGGPGNPNNIVAGYRPEDVNLDGVVKYNNTNADRLIILSTVGVTTPNRICNQHTPD